MRLRDGVRERGEGWGQGLGLEQVERGAYPTILAAIGQPLRPHQHMDGADLTPVLSGESELKRDALFWHYPHYNRHPQNFPAGVIRVGDWKLMQAFESGEVSLFNLADDIGETTNLAKKHPGRARRMLGWLNEWQQKVGADPMRPNPEYSRGK